MRVEQVVHRGCTGNAEREWREKTKQTTEDTEDTEKN